MAKLRTLVFEPSLRGHRGNFVRLLVDRLLTLGFDVELCCPAEELSESEGETFLSSVKGNISIREFRKLESGVSALRGAKDRLERLVDVAKLSRANTIYVPYADGLSQAWGLKLQCCSIMPRGTSFEGLMMRGRYAYPMNNVLESLQARLSLKAQQRSPWLLLHHLDAVAFSMVSAGGGSPRDRLIPEPIDPPRSISKEQARDVLMLDPHEPIITCPGGVTSTKGCDILARAVSLLDSQIDGRLVLFGRHSKSVKETIEKINRPDRILSMDRFATKEEFDCLFAAADVVALCYPRHIGSASILLRAAAYQKHVICSDWGWMGWAAREFNIGQTVNCDSIEAITEGLTLSLKSASNGEKKSQSERLKEFLAYHTPENHTSHWVQGICARLGIEPPSLVPHPLVSNLPRCC